MIQNLKQYYCGGCGEENHRIYKQIDNDHSLFAECTKCGSRTKITVETKAPELSLEWCDDSDGTLCIDT